MRVGILGESEVDEVAIRILVDGILGVETQPVLPPAIERSRGLAAALKSVRVVLHHLHYNTDADALVIVLDSNGSPPHLPRHEEPGGMDPRCRLCRLRETVRGIKSRLRPRQGKPPLTTAIGLAAPAVEAWYRCGHEAGANEMAWLQDLQERVNARQRILELKLRVYGTDRPSFSLAMNRAIEEARRLAANLDLLERHFPNGFGALLRDVQGWGS